MRQRKFLVGQHQAEGIFEKYVTGKAGYRHMRKKPSVGAVASHERLSRLVPAALCKSPKLFFQVRASKHQDLDSP